jgi:FkbM family methyltransferase
MRIGSRGSEDNFSDFRAADIAPRDQPSRVGTNGALPLLPGASKNADQRRKVAARLRFEEHIKKLVPARFYYPRKIAKEAKRSEPELAILRDIVPAGSTAVDVGANRGYYSYALSQIASYVEAFEPNPELARFAAAKLGANVQVHQVALSNREGAGTLYVPQTEQGIALHLLANLGQVHPSHHADEIEVRLATLDSYGFDDVGFIKIDAEGSEMDIIEGARETISRHRPTLLVELLAGTYRNPVEQINRIRHRFDYDAWILSDNDWIDACCALVLPLSTRNVLFMPR